MNDRIHILLLVAEPLRSDDGGGNTAINFFRGMDAEFAQIFCGDQFPENDFCKIYYQFSEQKRIKAFFHHTEVGNPILGNINTQRQIVEGNRKDNQNSLFCLIKRLRWNCFITAKHIISAKSNWKTSTLDSFILDFDPDVIYAPCYASPFLLELTRYVKNLTGKKVVTWSADDNYSLRQFSLDPFYWFNRFWVRSCLRKTYPYYDAFYSISEDEAVELEPIVKQKIGILRKCVPDGLEYKKREVNQPVRLIYAGGIYIQRWKVLEKIGKALANINRDGVKCVLHIYTQNALTEKQEKVLNDGKNIFCHTAVCQEKLFQLYAQSDIALHVESQALQNKLCTRLSFSTKIIDCLASGCAVMAIAWKEQTGLKYLQKNDAAICITDEDQIENTLRSLIENKNIIQDYAERAYKLAINNHDRKRIQGDLYERLVQLSK